MYPIPTTLNVIRNESPASAAYAAEREIQAGLLIKYFG